MNASHQLAAPSPGGSVAVGRLLLTVGAWVVGLFGMTRVGWFQQWVLLPMGALQQRLASDLMGAPRDTIVVDLSCTGADEMALCLGLALGFPATWRVRLAGALGGLALIMALNTMRIGTLSFVSTDPFLLDLLHLYVWPAILIVAIVAYMCVWMSRAVPAHAATAPAAAPAAASPQVALAWRFLGLTALFAAAYFLLVPRMFASPALWAVAGWVASTGGALITLVGVPATVAGNIVTTAHGGFVVTQECIATPLMPLFLAGTLTIPASRRRCALALALAPVLFFALGTARLLVLALPSALVASPTAAIHAFSQVLVAMFVVGATAFWVNLARDEPTGLWGRGRSAALAIGIGAVLGFGVGPAWSGGIGAAATWLQGLFQHAGHVYADPQSAVAMLPAFQFALFVALLVAATARPSWRHLLIGLSALALSQIGLFVHLGEFGWHYGFAPHVGLIRAWALGAPVLLFVCLERPFGPVAQAVRPVKQGC